VALTALQIAPVFEVKADPAQRPVLEARIRRISLVLQAQTLAETKVAAVHDSLVSQAFVSWDITAIPQAVSEEYSTLTALHLAPLFEVKADAAQQSVIEARVRKISMVMGAMDIAVGAIMGVQLDLAARGLSRWSVFDIPPAMEDVMVLLAAYELAPQFGMKAEPRDVVAAERSIARYIALPTSGERVTAEFF
jgi:hypothetical protein